MPAIMEYDGLEAHLLQRRHLPQVMKIARESLGPSVAEGAKNSFELYLKNRPTQEREGHVDGMQVHYYTLKQGRNIIGFTGLYSVPFESRLAGKKGNVILRLGWTGVSRARQGKGHGTRLIKITEKLAQKQGASHLAIETSGLYQKAMDVYGHLGYRRGYSGVADYYAKGKPLYTLYAKPRKTTPSDGYELRRLSLKEIAAMQPQIKRLAKQNTAHLLSLPYSSQGLANASLFGLFDSSKRLAGVADASRLSWIPKETVFTRFMHAQNPQARDALVKHLHAALAEEGVGVHVAHPSTETEFRSLLKRGFKEAKPNIPKFYAKEGSRPGELFVKALR